MSFFRSINFAGKMPVMVEALGTTLELSEITMEVTPLGHLLLNAYVNRVPVIRLHIPDHMAHELVDYWRMVEQMEDDDDYL